MPRDWGIFEGRDDSDPELEASVAYSRNPSMLDIPHHDRQERHEFGKSFGVPGLPGTGPRDPGVSPIPARSDHSHGAVGGGFGPTFHQETATGTVALGRSGRASIQGANKNIDAFVGRLATAGSTSTTFVVRMNNTTTLGTFTMASGETYHWFELTPNVLMHGDTAAGAGDYIDVEVTVAGTSAAKLVVHTVLA